MEKETLVNLLIEAINSVEHNDKLCGYQDQKCKYLWLGLDDNLQEECEHIKSGIKTR